MFCDDWIAVLDGHSVTMKVSSFIFIVSFAANLALLLVLRSIPSPAAEPVVHVVSPYARTSSFSPSARTEGDRSPGFLDAAQGGTAGHDTSWHELHSDNPGVFVARLRAAGFPPHVLQAVVSSLVNEQYLSRREDLMSDTADAPFWQQAPNAFSDPKRAAALITLNRERNELLRQLLGEDAPRGDELQEVYLRRQFGDLPPEKMRRLQDVLTDYREMRIQLHPPNQPVTAVERERFATLDKEMRADLEKLLTPQELEQYDLRSSATAGQLRHRLDAFKPSEDEYRGIFQLSRSIEERFPLAAGVIDPQLLAARRAAEQRLEPQLKAQLGPERYADYQQATNPSYATLNQIVSRFDLPLSSAREAVVVQKEIMGRAQAVLTSDELTPAQQDAQLKALSREASTKLRAALTPRGLEAYKQHGGAWLDRLSSSPSGAPR
jgi:hypothetical protein